METLEGFIEGIRFKSEETGYVVCRINTEKVSIVAVGTVPFLREGQNVKVSGEWTTHKQFGKQFNIKSCEEIMPTSIKDMEKYLASGIIRGVGPVTAKKIINHFGEDTLKIMDADISRLSEIEGIGEKKLKIICESYLEQNDLKNIIIFFQSFGITNGQCLKIYKKLGQDAKEKIEKDPYLLCREVKGIGFLTADRIAKLIGIENHDESRIRSGVEFIINRFCAFGNTYMPKDAVIKESKELLGVDEDLIVQIVYNMITDKKLIIQNIKDEECVFIPIYYYSELGITERIAKLAIQNYKDINSDIQFKIEVFEKEYSMKFSESQKEAIFGAFENGVEIITGGPGTGKTTIIKCIIELYEDIGMKVLLAAPTGRAAKRITESTGRAAKTIHRLLEIGAGEEDIILGGTAKEELEGDVVIIDEASMIDIFLMYNLLKAVRVGTRLIIVGDVDQLPSVGPGNVLKDLIESNLLTTFRLTDIFRQGEESLIITNAHRINKGNMPILNKRDKDFFFQRSEDMNDILNIVLELVNKRLPNFNKSLDKKRDIQVLSPVKKGILGVINLNEKLQEILNPPSENKKQKKQKDLILREGDKVMQTKNNYSLRWTLERTSESGEGIFNGDMGFIQSIDENQKTLTVIFDDERKVVYTPESIEELELAYAITIHKSQGSEFRVVIIPVFMGAPLLMNRNLLYTGITRAKEIVTVVGYPNALKYMVENNRDLDRHSTLGNRIRELLSNDIFE